MLVETGHFALVLALALALVQAVLPLWGAVRRDPTRRRMSVPMLRKRSSWSVIRSSRC